MFIGGGGNLLYVLRILSSVFQLLGSTFTRVFHADGDLLDFFNKH